MENEEFDFRHSNSKSPTTTNANRSSRLINKKHISFGGSRKSSQTLTPTSNLSGGFVDVAYVEDSEEGSTQVEDDDENKIEADVSRKETVMKRNRWGTQRHKKGRPPKRSKSIFNKKRHSSHQPPRHQDGHEFPDAEDAEQVNGNRRIYVNYPLPEDMIDPESGLPICDFPRNKIRTTKYTPLSFVPKNLWYQFHNIANIYFLLIVILGVSIFPRDSSQMTKY